MPISTLNGVAWSALSSLHGVAKASIATVNGVAGGPSLVLKDSYLAGTEGGTVNVANSAGNLYCGGSFTAGLSYTLVAFKVVGLSVITNTPTITITPYVYSNSSGSPGSVLTTGTARTLSDITTSPPDGKPLFEGMSTAISSGTVYWLVLKASAVDTGDYFAWKWSSNFLSGVPKVSSDGSTWNNSISRRMWFETYASS